MKHRLRASATLGALLLAHSAHATDVSVCTDRGRAVFELADEASPLHVANFLRYVDMGFYTGTVFHRVRAGFVVQGGGFDRQLRPRSTLAPVANESGNGLSNARGTVAAARSADRDSADSQFFVNLGDNTALGDYTVFGRVKEGMELFDEIGALPTAASGPLETDVPMPLVAIKSITQLDDAALAALPVEDRETVLKGEVATAVAAGNPMDALRMIGHYRALCGGDDAELTLTEARMALAAGDRRRALFALDELLATTDASQPIFEAATALYLEASAEVAATAQVVGNCTPPEVPPLPDAAAASLDEMMAAQRQVREFVAAGEAHLACLDKVIDDAERGADQRNSAVGEHNRIVAAMEEIAAAFNERIRIFKARG